MSLKQIVIIIAVGSGVLISMNAMNAIYFLPFSWFLLFEIISGPILTIILLPKEYWLRVNVFIFTLAGAAGFAQIVSDFGGLYLLGMDLRHPVDLYIYQGVVSSLFVISFFIWYAFDKRGRTKKNQKKDKVPE